MPDNNHITHQNMTKQWYNNDVTLGAPNNASPSAQTSQNNNPPTATTSNDTDNNAAWQLHSQPSSLMITINPLCSPEWDQFYAEHVQFMKECYLELLSMMPQSFDNNPFNDNNSNHIHIDDSPMSSIS